ncbi:SH3 domain-binding protein 5 homolog [Contarinia nasturtii]|uniref:SH3 domain-binding protein 5 homolog n=1 Tax=Contarinia nasturtii TaxID=265458 RepID=UPI0012D3B8B6|nr:SH3 domain-binding protein 5 homolog [Contarinia nasturtii]XP_031640516.1 SH3 domain-binding protein 5 homolog [Contarinia nasturtii]
MEMEQQQNNELDPRIQIELENLNTATEEINRLEIELEEANSTFNILYNESTRRLKLLIKKLGSCIEKSRPYYENSEKARLARIECQAAAAEFRRANEIHAAAKETVALAEERFMTNSHNWPFDNAWQEMLNHATNKVAEAEKKKAEAHAEHQRKAHVFNKIDLETQQIEERQRRNIQKSRPYFEEKQLCQEQLETQKERIHELEIQIKSTKASYAMSLKNLEKISEEIHRTRGTDLSITPPGPMGEREPGVGATDDDDYEDPSSSDTIKDENSKNKLKNLPIADIMNQMENDNSMDAKSLDTNSIFSEDKDDEDYAQSLDDTLSMKRGGIYADGVGSSSMTTNSRNEPADIISADCDNHDLNLEELRQKVKVLAVRPVEGGDGQTKDCWESELNETVNKLDRLMMLQENNKSRNVNSNQGVVHNSSASKLTGGLVDKPPKPIKYSQATNNHFYTPTHTVSSSMARANCESHIQPVNNSQTTTPTTTTTSSTTKAFLNSSLQAVQQKMLASSQTSTSSASSITKELPLLSRISNEISANTANTVKVLKRRLSLN